MNTIKLHNWRTIYALGCTPYTAPECLQIALEGNVYGDDKHRDGTLIITSAIINVEGRTVYTKDTIYTLGTIHTGFRQWLRKNRPQWNYKKPITHEKK